MASLIQTLEALTTVFLLLVTITPATAAPSPAPPYKNHTVGGTDGWFYNSATQFPATNYSAWAANQSFSLGDYLIFNTNTNSSVVLTTNATTFEQCYASTDEGNSTLIYSGNVGGSNSSAAKTESLEVPLTFEGINFFFSDTEDGQQCLNGMRFVINVSHGGGLPDSLTPPPPPVKPAALPPPGSPENGSTKSTNFGVVSGGLITGWIWAFFGLLNLIFVAI